MNPRTPSRGFTLIEVMVALVIGGMVVAGAAALFTALSGRADALKQASLAAETDANAERLVRALVANLELRRDSTTLSLAGNQDSARFHSWCETAMEWLDRCDIRLSFDRSAAPALKLSVRGPDSVDVQLASGFRTGYLRYLNVIDHRLTWRSSWDQHTLPRALTVVLDADTLLLPLPIGD